MPIVFGCGCGKTLQVPDEHAGRRVKCPSCNGVSFAPGGAEPEFEVVENAPRSPAPQANENQPKPRPKPTAREEDEEDAPRGLGLARGGEDKPRRKKKTKGRSKRSATCYDGDADEQWRSRRSTVNLYSRWVYIVVGLALLALGMGLIYICVEFSNPQRRVRTITLGVLICISALGTIFGHGIFGSDDDD